MHLAGSRPHRNGSSNFGRKRLPDRTCLGARRKEWLACCRQRDSDDPAIFDKPQRIIRIWLVFEDAENARTQEFLLQQLLLPTNIKRTASHLFSRSWECANLSPTAAEPAVQRSDDLEI